MAYTNFLGPIVTGDNDFQKFAKTQAQLHLATVNAGITIDPVSNPLLTDIVTGDNDFQKWAKLNAWASNLASGVSPIAGQAQAGNPAVATSATSKAITFSPAFAAAPVVVCNLIPPGGGDPILATPINVTTTGFTATWGFAVPAGYTLSWQAVPATQ